jgi:hypothetical protein
MVRRVKVEDSACDDVPGCTAGFLLVKFTGSTAPQPHAQAQPLAPRLLTST